MICLHGGTACFSWALNHYGGNIAGFAISDKYALNYPSVNAANMLECKT